MKTCTKCKEEKELTEFSKRKASHDGLQPKCKACTKAYYEANRERIAEKQHEYQKANREHILEYRREYYRVNRERAAEYQREYKKAHLLMYREINGRQRAKKHGAPTGHADYELVVATSNGLCGICGEPIFGKFDIDHIVPLNKGGAHSMDNLQVAHAYCNRSKGMRLTA